MTETVATDGAFAHGRSRVAYALLADQRIEELLDYGCGRGQIALAAARQRLSKKVHACDIDAGQIAELNRRHGDEVNFFAISDVTPAFPLDDGQVSAITCCDVLEHMPAATSIAVLGEMNRVLADDGVLVLTVPHESLPATFDPENAKVYFPRLHRFVYVLSRGRAQYEKTYGGDHFGNFSAGAVKHEHFSRDDLALLLRGADLQVDEVRYYGLIYPLARTLLWLSEAVERRFGWARPITALMWRLYRWDADLEPGRIGCFIAIRARKANG